MIYRFRRYIALFFVCIALAYPVKKAEAIIPVIAGWLLTVGGDAILITDIVAAQAAILSAIAWYDCNKWSNTAVCTNKAQGQPASGQPKPALTVSLAPNVTRQNPDPKKFDNPTGGKRDVSPKATLPKNLPTPAPAAGVPSPPASPPPTLADTVSYYDPTAMDIHGTTAEQWRFMRSALNGYARIVTVFYVNDLSPGRMKVITTIYQALAIKLTCTTPTQYCDADSAAIKKTEDDAMARLRADYPAAWDPKFSPVFVRYPNNPASGWHYTGVGLQFPTQYAQYSCDKGYVTSTDGCRLTDPTKVVKPDTTPCEILYDPATKTMLGDPANPNCTGNGTVNGNTFTITNSADGSSMTVTANASGGFNITRTNADGSSNTASTGPYDQVGQGYPVTQTATNGNGKDPKGANCGVPGLPACNVAMSVDSETTNVKDTAQDGVKTGIGSLKGALDSIDSDKFKWTFIPQIPAAQCVEPSVRNPLNDSLVSMPICGAFNGLSFFVNCVMAVLCLYGCVRQIQAALAA